MTAVQLLVVCRKADIIVRSSDKVVRWRTTSYDEERRSYDVVRSRTISHPRIPHHKRRKISLDHRTISWEDGATPLINIFGGRKGEHGIRLAAASHDDRSASDNPGIQSGNRSQVF